MTLDWSRPQIYTNTGTYDTCLDLELKNRKLESEISLLQKELKYHNQI
jgi:hypothetical protein